MLQRAALQERPVAPVALLQRPAPSQERLVLQQHLLQRLAVSLKRPVAPAAPVAASISLARASCGSSTCCSVWQTPAAAAAPVSRSSSLAGASCGSVALAAAVATSGSVAGPVAEARDAAETLQRKDQWLWQRSVTWIGAQQPTKARRNRDGNIIIDEREYSILVAN